MRPTFAKQDFFQRASSVFPWSWSFRQSRRAMTPPPLPSPRSSSRGAFSSKPPVPHPNSLFTKQCRFFARGFCREADKCTFIHSIHNEGSSKTRDTRDPRASNVCFDFQNYGGCSRGDYCRFSHDLDPVGNDAYPCRDFQLGECARGNDPRKTQRCRYFGKGNLICHRGDKCPFLHQPSGRVISHIA